MPCGCTLLQVEMDSYSWPRRMAVKVCGLWQHVLSRPSLTTSLSDPQFLLCKRPTPNSRVALTQHVAQLILQFCVVPPLQICTHSDFELIVMLLIFGNCISLALYNPMEPDDSVHNDTLTKFGAQRG